MLVSQICDFYRNKTVLITGGTGFVGKILVEKLLRTTEIAKMYLILREKGTKSCEERFGELFEDAVFSRLKSEKPDFTSRIEAIDGDCSKDNLGISVKDREILLSEVNIVFHSAATVNFKENIKTAYMVNVKAVEEILKFSAKIKNLEAFIDISTAYANCHLKSRFIEEVFYDYPVDHETVGKIIEKSSDSEDYVIKSLMGDWPNTYTFTKALSEAVIKDHQEEIPIGIFRPSIVMSTYKEPIEGWTDNLNVPTGIFVQSWSALLRVFRVDKNIVANTVPVDFCAAAIIATAWDVATRKSQIDKKDNTSIIYNYVATSESEVTWKHLCENVRLHIENYPNFKIYFLTTLILIKNETLFILMRFFLHTIPAALLDLMLTLTAKKAKFLRIYKKIHVFCDAISAFSKSSPEFRFSSDNTKQLWQKMNEIDKKLFQFDLTSIDLQTYHENYAKGIRVYILKEDPESIEKSKSKSARYKFCKNLFINIPRLVVLQLILSFLIHSLVINDIFTLL